MEIQAAIDINADNITMIDIERLSIALHEQLESLYPLSDRDNTIYRVPKRLRELNEKAYTPQVVSIGPLHYGTEKLLPMEEHKRRYLQDFLRRTEQYNIVDFVAIIKSNEVRLRNSYPEEIRLCSDEFVTMILVDAAFIIEILLKSKFRNLQNRNDRIFTKPWMLADIMFDMCLLENQLPFFILKELGDCLHMASRDDKPPIIKLIHEFTKDCWDFSKVDDDKCFDRVDHLVDFLSICLVPSESDRPMRTGFVTLAAPSVTELHHAGVKFKMAPNKSLFEIKFNGGSGILEIPRLKIVKETELMFRNLLAFEQCHGSTNCINDFIILINHLVNTPKEVEFLIHLGIIENWLPDIDEVSTLFHNLVKETSIIPDQFYFAPLVEDMDRYCKSPWHMWKASLYELTLETYKRNPWAGISFFTAVVLLTLTSIQTIYAVIKK